MPRDASELARRLARDAEAVCRHYLSKGRRQGRYWMVGDVRNTPGRSMYVRLSGPESGPGAAGRWSDAASAEHGDLLDVIRESCGLMEFREVAEEARRFLSLPRAEPPVAPRAPAPGGSAEAARRLWQHCRAIGGTHAEAYLHARGLAGCRFPALRFHPELFYRDGTAQSGPARRLPALIAAVTGGDGLIHGVQRTWLDHRVPVKADVANPRKALGRIFGHAVRFGSQAGNAAASNRETSLLVGEGIETVLSLVTAWPHITAAAALSAGSLGAFAPPSGVAHVVIARDNDPQGAHAAERLVRRCARAGIAATVIVSERADFNDDLVALGAEALRVRLAHLFPAPVPAKPQE